MVPRNLNDSTAVTELFMMVSGGEQGGILLKSTIISTVLSVLSSRLFKTAPESQLHDLLSVSRLVTVPDEDDQCGVVCQLQELDRGVFGCAVVRVHICHTFAHILYTYATFLILLDIFSNMNVKRIT